MFRFLHILRFILPVILSMSVNAQTYITIYPDVESQTIEIIEITKIEINEVFTIVDMFYNARGNEGWICASRDFYIQPSNSNERKYLIMAKDIPICPKKVIIDSYKDEYKFQLYFPGIDPLVRKIDIVEKPETGFNFFGVWLNPESTESLTDSCRFRSRTEFETYFNSNSLSLNPIEGVWKVVSKKSHYVDNNFLEYLEDEVTREVAILNKGDHFKCYEMDGKSLDVKFYIISHGGRYLYKEYFNLVREEITSFVHVEKEGYFKHTYAIPEKWAKYQLQGEFFPGDKLLNELKWEKIFPLSQNDSK